MTQDYRHHITPPPELVQQWASETLTTQSLCNRAAQWGADQELEACCDVLHQHDRAYFLPSQLRAARRPKPASLKEQVIAVLEDAKLDAAHYNILLHALEQLPEAW